MATTKNVGKKKKNSRFSISEAKKLLSKTLTEHKRLTFQNYR